jgi:DNA polymerase-3 subunit delta'
MWSTIGHDRAVNALRRALDSERVSHAYLLSGPRHVGKMTLAIDLARAVNCLGNERPCGECGQCQRIARGLHADVQTVGLDADESAGGRSRVTIGIDQVRAVQRDASLKPYEGSCRVFIFDGAEHLSEEAANCLLKTLEEPPDQVILVLLTCDAGSLLPTLVSRCQLLALRPVSVTLIARELELSHGMNGAEADRIARLSDGRPGWAVRASTQPDLLDQITSRLMVVEDIVKSGPEERFAYAASMASSFARNRESAQQELSIWTAWWRDVLLVKQGDPGSVANPSRMDTLQAVADALPPEQVVGAINAVLETADFLDRNASPRLALEELMLAIPRP